MRFVMGSFLKLNCFKWQIYEAGVARFLFLFFVNIAKIPLCKKKHTNTFENKSTNTFENKVLGRAS